MNQSWVTFLSLLVSGTMLFTLAATLILYAKYKMGQGPVLQLAGQAPHAYAQATAPRQAEPLSLDEALDTLQTAQMKKEDLKPTKRNLAFLKTLLLSVAHRNSLRSPWINSRNFYLE